MHPLTQKAIANGINVVGKAVIEKAMNNRKNNSEEEITQQTIDKLEDLQESIENLEEDKNIQQQKQNIQTEEQPEKNQEEKSELEDKDIKELYSKYAPGMNKEKGCIPCTLAHLLAIRGFLNEALRFAREDGIEHEEVILRIEKSVEEVMAMERLDLTEDKIHNYPDEKTEILDNVLNRVRVLRQNILNNINSVDDLKEEVVRVNDIYEYLRDSI